MTNIIYFKNSGTIAHIQNAILDSFISASWDFKEIWELIGLSCFDHLPDTRTSGTGKSTARRCGTSRASAPGAGRTLWDRTADSRGPALRCPAPATASSCTVAPRSWWPPANRCTPCTAGSGARSGRRPGSRCPRTYNLTYSLTRHRAGRLPQPSPPLTVTTRYYCCWRPLWPPRPLPTPTSGRHTQSVPACWRTGPSGDSCACSDSTRLYLHNLFLWFQIQACICNSTCGGGGIAEG